MNSVFRKGVLQWGGSLQRLAVKALDKAPAAITEKDRCSLALFKSPMMSPSPAPLTALLPQCTEREALKIRPNGEIDKTVFYFPGCGSERIYGDIGMAAIYLLLKNNIRVILPPPSLCCGFPARVNAKKKMAGQILLRDTIILSQIREMLGHLNFDALLISCGTCRESLQAMGCAEIFDCRIEDICRFILDNTEHQFDAKRAEPILYHTPCHDSCNGDGLSLLGRLYKDVTSVATCCSEAGTMAISRPDISHAMLQRKRQALAIAKTGSEMTLVATNCPSCISGLGRNKDLQIVPKHMAVILAELLGGQEWAEEFAELVREAEKVTF